MAESRMVEGTVEVMTLVEQEGYQKPSEGTMVTVDLAEKLETGEAVDPRTATYFVTDNERGDLRYRQRGDG